MTEENEKHFADFLAKVTSHEHLPEEDAQELAFEMIDQKKKTADHMQAVEMMIYEVIKKYNNLVRHDVAKTLHEHESNVKLLTLVYSHDSGMNISISVPRDVVVRRSHIEEGVSVLYQYTDKFSFRKMSGEAFRCNVANVMKNRGRIIFPENEAREEKQAIDDMVFLAGNVDSAAMSLMMDVLHPISNFFTDEKSRVSHFHKVATKPFYAMQLIVRNGKNELLRVRIT